MLIAAAFLRLHSLQTIALGNDEIAQVRWSSLPMREMLNAVRRDLVHPPLDYFIQYALGRLGATEWSRHLPSVIFGVATVAMIMVVTRFWFSAVAGLVAGLLLALSPIHIRFSQEIRPYSLGLCLVAASALMLELYLSSGKRRWFALWFLSVFLAGLTLYFAGLCAVVLSVARGSQLWRKFPIVIAAWTVLYLPWIGVVVTAFRRRPPIRPDTLDSSWWLSRLQAFGSWPFWILVTIGILVSVRAKLLRTATAWLIIGGALEILILQIRPHYSTARHLMPAWLGAIVLAGAGCAVLLRSRYAAVAAAALVALFCAFAIRDIADYYRSGRADWRAVAHFVHGAAKGGDAIVLANEWTVRNFGWYWLQLPRRTDVRIERFARSAIPAKGPLWVVSAECRWRRDLLEVPLVRAFPETDGAEVRYLPPGRELPISEPVCRETWE